MLVLEWPCLVLAIKVFLTPITKDSRTHMFFEPDLSPEVLNSRPVPEMERLSTLYNADVGLYMLANKWMVNKTELGVIHYTLGPLKPWDWTCRYAASLMLPDRFSMKKGDVFSYQPYAMGPIRRN